MDTLPISLILNPGSGSRRDPALALSILDTLSAGGRQVEWLKPRRGAEIPAMAAKAMAHGPRLMVAAGGDGTVNAVAGAVLAHPGSELGVIPLGTFNYFARGLRLPEDPLAAAALVRDGHTTPISVGSANGRVFLVHASFGLYRSVIEARERHKNLIGRHRLVAAISGLITALRPHPHYRLKLGIGDEAMRRVSSMVYFGANPLQNAELGVGGADTPESGLAVFVLRPMTRWQVLVTTCHALFGHVADSESIEVFHAQEVTVERHRKRINLVLDGEIFHEQSPLVVRWLPDALPVRVAHVTGDNAQALQDAPPPATVEPAA